MYLQIQKILFLIIILDAGTTSAVAHKLQRRYIGMEQMDSQISLITTRLQNVISGDSTGILQSVNWQGGGLLSIVN